VPDGTGGAGSVVVVDVVVVDVVLDVVLEVVLDVVDVVVVVVLLVELLVELTAAAVVVGTAVVVVASRTLVTDASEADVSLLQAAPPSPSTSRSTVRLIGRGREGIAP
jgi:hypothetical protein